MSEEYDKACNQFQTAIDDEIKRIAEQEMERLKSSAESYKHWKKLHYFEDVCRNNTTIILKGNERKILEEFAQGNELEVENMVQNVFSKVSREFLKIQKVLFGPTAGNRTIIAVDKVEVQGFDEQFKSRLENEYQRLKSEIENGVVITKKHDVKRLEGTEQLEKKITSLIETKGLISPGHFVMNNKYCASNWIDTQAILENSEVYRSCLDLYIKHIKKMDFNNMFLIGLDLQGALIASTIGFILNVPFTYIIPVHKKKQNSERDSLLNFKNEKNTILFTDVITTAKSIDEACISYHIQKNSIKAIYTVLYRPARKSNNEVEILLGKYANKVYYINDKYIVDLMSREGCERNTPEKCLACNKQIDLGGNGI